MPRTVLYQPYAAGTNMSARDIVTSYNRDNISTFTDDILGFNNATLSNFVAKEQGRPDDPLNQNGVHIDSKAYINDMLSQWASEGRIDDRVVLNLSDAIESRDFDATELDAFAYYLHNIDMAKDQSGFNMSESLGDTSNDEFRDQLMNSFSHDEKRGRDNDLARDRILQVQRIVYQEQIESISRIMLQGQDGYDLSAAELLNIYDNANPALSDDMSVSNGTARITQMRNMYRDSEGNYDYQRMLNDAASNIGLGAQFNSAVTDIDFTDLTDEQKAIIETLSMHASEVSMRNGYVDGNVTNLVISSGDLSAALHASDMSYVNDTMLPNMIYEPGGVNMGMELMIITPDIVRDEGVLLNNERERQAQITREQAAEAQRQQAEHIAEMARREAERREAERVASQTQTANETQTQAETGTQTQTNTSGYDDRGFRLNDNPDNENSNDTTTGQRSDAINAGIVTYWQEYENLDGMSEEELRELAVSMGMDVDEIDGADIREEMENHIDMVAYELSTGSVDFATFDEYYDTLSESDRMTLYYNELREADRAAGGDGHPAYEEPGEEELRTVIQDIYADYDDMREIWQDAEVVNDGTQTYNAGQYSGATVRQDYDDITPDTDTHSVTPADLLENDGLSIVIRDVTQPKYGSGGIIDQYTPDPTDYMAQLRADGVAISGIDRSTLTMMSILSENGYMDTESVRMYVNADNDSRDQMMADVMSAWLNDPGATGKDLLTANMAFESIVKTDNGQDLGALGVLNQQSIDTLLGNSEDIHVNTFYQADISADTLVLVDEMLLGYSDEIDVEQYDKYCDSLESKALMMGYLGNNVQETAAALDFLKQDFEKDNGKDPETYLKDWCYDEAIKSGMSPEEARAEVENMMNHIEHPEVNITDEYDEHKDRAYRWMLANGEPPADMDPKAFEAYRIVTLDKATNNGQEIRATQSLMREAITAGIQAFRSVLSNSEMGQQILMFCNTVVHMPPINGTMFQEIWDLDTTMAYHEEEMVIKGVKREEQVKQEKIPVAINGEVRYVDPEVIENHPELEVYIPETPGPTPPPTRPPKTEEPTDPESTEPESTEPESTEPESTEPESTEPESTEPESTEPESEEEIEEESSNPNVESKVGGNDLGDTTGQDNAETGIGDGTVIDIDISDSTDNNDSTNTGGDQNGTNDNDNQQPDGAEVQPSENDGPSILNAAQDAAQEAPQEATQEATQEADNGGEQQHGPSQSPDVSGKQDDAEYGD